MRTSALLFSSWGHIEKAVVEVELMRALSA
jgi:hypothetical protein